MDDDLDAPPERVKEEVVVKLKKPTVIKIPKREPSLIVPSREIIYFTADKTTCEYCVCYPKDSPYAPAGKQKLHPCMATPWTLYEYAALVVEKLLYPKAFNWSVEEVAEWMANEVGFKQYADCIRENKINGRRLIMFENPSLLARINIPYLEHQKRITKKVHELFETEYPYFARSIGLPRRKLLATLNWFKSRTGPTWGIRQNWSRADLLRAMQIINPAPVRMDHWDLVWYQKPDFYKTLFGWIPPYITQNFIPHYTPYPEVNREYTAPRKFRFDPNISESDQFIWLQHRPESDPNMAGNWVRPKEKKPKKIWPGARLCPKPPSLKGKAGNQLLLTLRLRPKPKFFLDCGKIPARV